MFTVAPPIVLASVRPVPGVAFPDVLQLRLWTTSVKDNCAQNLERLSGVLLVVETDQQGQSPAAGNRAPCGFCKSALRNLSLFPVLCRELAKTVACCRAGNKNSWPRSGTGAMPDEGIAEGGRALDKQPVTNLKRGRHLGTRFRACKEPVRISLFPSEKFDVVTMIEVLEHTNSDRQGAERVFSCLEARGTLGPLCSEQAVPFWKSSLPHWCFRSRPQYSSGFMVS